MREDKKNLAKKVYLPGTLLTISCLLLTAYCLLFLISCAKPLYREKYLTAGTFLEVVSPDKRAGRIVYDEFKRLEKIFNFYDPGSELSKLNVSFNFPVKVSDELFEIISLAKQVNIMSQGAFDPTYGELFRFWKDLIKKGGIGRLPPGDVIDGMKKFCGMEYVILDKGQKTVTIKRASLKIDLGGIADGYMVDKSVAKLKKAGINSALINVGGDIYCLGKNGNVPWSVGIQNPREIEGVMAAQYLENEAVTTSGNYAQFFKLNGKVYSHIIDPRTGYPVDNNIISVTVIAGNCTTADALATSFFIMGLEKTMNFIASRRSTMRVFVVTMDDKGKKNIHVIK